MRAIVIHKDDNVATALDHIPAGSIPQILGFGEVGANIVVKSDIPIGHKFALKRIVREVVKYGEVIGEVTRVIELGEHVHVQNVKSLRGRGDLRDKP